MKNLNELTFFRGTMTCLAGLLRQFTGRGRYEKRMRNRYVGA